MAEEKTIIIKNEEENKSNFTFRNYIHALKHFKYWILGISLIFGVIGYLVASLGINKITQKVSSTFSYSFPTTYYYAKEATLFTGDTINIGSVNSTNNIREVYENTLDDDGNKVFSKLNLDDIIEQANISLETEVNNYVTRTNTEPVSSDTFTLTASVRPFKNEALASKFLEELINLIPTQVSKIFEDYRITNDLVNVSAGSSFIVSVASIKTQYETISSKYVVLSNSFSKDFYVPSEDKTISELENAFYIDYALGSSNLIYELESDLYSNGYTNYVLHQKDAMLEELNSNKDALEKEKEERTKEKANLEALISSFQYVNLNSNSDSTSTSALSNRFIDYVEALERTNRRISTVDRYIALIDKQITNVTTSDSTYLSDCAAFKTRIANLIERLNNSTTKVSNIISEVSKSNIKNVAIFASSKKIELKGNIPPILVAFVGLIVGYIASSLIYTYYYVNFLLNKEEKHKAVRKETPKELKK